MPASYIQTITRKKNSLTPRWEASIFTHFKQDAFSTRKKYFFVVFLFTLTACRSTTSPTYFPLDEDFHAHFSIQIETMDGVRHEKYSIENFASVKNEALTLYPRQTGDGSRLLYRIEDNWLLRHASQIPGQQARKESPPVKILPVQFDSDNPPRWTINTTTFLLENSGPPQDTLFRIQEPLTLHVSIVDQQASVDVPAGHFDQCLKLIATGYVNADVGNYVGKTRIEVTQTSWYAPDVGLVKTQRTETTTNKQIAKGEFILEKIE